MANIVAVVCCAVETGYCDTVVTGSDEVVVEPGSAKPEGYTNESVINIICPVAPLCVWWVVSFSDDYPTTPPMAKNVVGLSGKVTLATGEYGPNSCVSKSCFIKESARDHHPHVEGEGNTGSS